MNLAHYIYSFLQEQDKQVKVPNLGIFSLEKTHAVVDEQASKIIPPKEFVSFEKTHISQDQSLAEFISLQTDLSLTEAQNQISNEVEKWLSELNNKHILVLENLGEIHIDSEGNWHFSPKNNPHSMDFFGLEEINLKEITPPNDPACNKSFFWIFIIILVTAGLAVLAYFHQDWILEQIQPPTPKANIEPTKPISPKDTLTTPVQVSKTTDSIQSQP